MKHCCLITKRKHLSLTHQDAHQLAEILTKHRPLLHGWSNGSAAADGASESEGLRRVVADYTAARLARVCRMQVGV